MKTIYKISLLSFLLSIVTVDAGYSQAKTYDFPKPVDTTTRSIKLQERRTFEISPNLYADNQFRGARLNNVSVDNGIIEAYIEPENAPINASPWYAFRLWSVDSTETRTVKISYAEDYKHRYWPKLSDNGDTWIEADSSDVKVAEDTSYVEIRLTIPMDTIWIAAQPIVDSKDVYNWCENLAKNRLVDYKIIGKSTGGRDIPFMMISNGKEKKKKVVVLLSRQHPPEVTGFFALQAFLDEILKDSELSKNFLDDYVLLVYPILNPDGVDEGHWRHNLGGIDLNRDWAYYHQKETREVADHIVETVKKIKGKVVLGLDFHSTWYDVYYTPARDLDIVNVDFTDKWLNYIKGKIPGYDPRDEPSGITQPVSKGWFVTQFGANGITYEIGDSTPKEFIKEKSEIAADGMMMILLDPDKFK